MDDVDEILRLVADGTLSAEEADRLLAALDEAEGRGSNARARGGSGERFVRIEVSEHGRQVVNVRLPIGLIGAASSLVPGLAGGHAERIREALRSGISGPIIEVDDGGDRVVISAE